MKFRGECKWWGLGFNDGEPTAQPESYSVTKINLKMARKNRKTTNLSQNRVE
jgi:hypothetical protein